MWGNSVETVAAILTDNFIQCESLDADRTIDEFDPIALTSEILSALRFENNCGWWSHERFLSLTILQQYHPELGDIFHLTSDETIISAPIQALHHLQNLYFSLTNEELEVTLPASISALSH